MEILKLSKGEIAPLRRLAKELGMTVDEVAEMAAKEALKQMFELPVYPGEVVRFEGLKRPEEDKNDG